jgi:(E)-4-hydroxy-3-methylbut-2-enyl-diphosphate synthase
LITRRLSKPIKVGAVTIGGNSPIVVQSMTKTDTRNIPATINQIKELAECGCEIIRIAVPDNEAAQALTTIKNNSPTPIIADIHFDYRLALAALKANIDGLRLNPGNISDPKQIAKIVRAAKERNVPIRIGINAGSLPPTSKLYSSIAEHMVSVALEQVQLLENLDFDLIKVSLKAFNVPATIEAYRMIASRISYPLHLGITEAGIPKAGAIRSAVGIGILLYEGIGDTIRVSLSSHPCDEVYTTFEILKALELRQHGPTLISCPSCGRSEVDILGLAEAVDKKLREITKPIKVAVMGCVVNGPGEAKEADIGIACGKGKGAIFKKGQIVRTIPEKDLLKSLVEEINNLLTLD